VSDTVDHERREIYFHGMVQGVGFRYTTRMIVSRFAVTGYVKNLPDGRVLLVAEGDGGEIQRFLDSINLELGHYIGHREEIAEPASGEFRRFDIRF